jgi:hypothetical protein
VATVESWAGPTVEGDLTQANIMLAGHITTWLRDLKRAAELRSPARRD